MMHRFARRAVLSIALGIAGCAAPGGDLPPLPDARPGPYRLGAGDEVRITVFGQDQLSEKYLVGDDGTVALPLLGPVAAAGHTTAELAAGIADALRARHLLQDPSVAVEVITYRPIFVLGEVNKPGQYPWQPGMTVVTAVAVAGGFTYRAVEDRASIIRSTDGRARESRARRSSLVRPGDVITIFERHF
jgi:polysaccharide export outer membrane protein